MTGFKSLVKHKLVIAVAALMAPIGVFMFVYFPSHFATGITEVLHDNTRSVAEMAAAAAVPGLERSDAAAAGDALKPLGKVAAVEAAAVHDATGPASPSANRRTVSCSAGKGKQPRTS